MAAQVVAPFKLKDTNIERVSVSPGAINEIPDSGGGDSSIYHFPCKLHAENKGETEFCSFEAVICTATDPSKSFYRLGIPTFVYDKMEGVFGTGMQVAGFKKATLRTEDYVHVTLDKRKWKCTANDRQVMYATHEGETTSMEISYLFPTLNKAPLRIYVLARFSASTKANQTVDHVMSGDDWKLGLSVMDCRMLGLSDTTLFSTDIPQTTTRLRGTVPVEDARLTSMLLASGFIRQGADCFASHDGSLVEEDDE